MNYINLFFLQIQLNISLQTTAFYNLLPETAFSLATTDIDLARLHHNTYRSALVSACQMMNWPNKFLIWSNTLTLALSIGTLQRNAAQITDIYIYIKKSNEICMLVHIITNFFYIHVYIYLMGLGQKPPDKKPPNNDEK